MTLQENARLVTLANLEHPNDVYYLNIPRTLIRYLAFGRENGQPKPPRRWQEKPKV